VQTFRDDRPYADEKIIKFCSGAVNVLSESESEGFLVKKPVLTNIHCECWKEQAEV